MVEPGEQLPEEVLALIFRHLPLRGRANAARVCKAWAAAATCSAVWHDTNISCECELEGMLPPHLFACLDHIHNLRLEFEPSREPSRRAATELLTALAGRTPGLRGLCLECRGEKPLFDSGRDVLDSLHALCGAAGALRHLDLRGLPFTLDDALVLQVALGCPELRSLFLDNGTLVGSVGPGSVLELLEACPRLRALGLHLASLSRTAAALRLSLSGDTVGPVRFAAHHYAATLRALEVRATSSAELDTALEELAARCAELREVHCFCVVRASVLHSFRAHCPHLRSYTLKLTREPHPWRPTLVA
uniref:F-box/LRR-repeat protein 8 n=1 Tax=Camelus bactrianus TaxID=9837 RepID=A0A9W3F0A6_CAMBA|nr:F-box/LRR-repeat protein 8 [Camelus bactrianus]